MELVRWFTSIGRNDVAIAGGKGANVGEMARAGLATPPGFVLLTAAYRMFVEANELQGEIERLARSIDEAGTAVEEVSLAIKGLFERGAMPAEIEKAALAAYSELGEGAVAVRSSATAEDMEEASFAGQQESYLNIQSKDEVLSAVRRCWSSLWTARAIAYRARQGIAPEVVALAVMIQRMVFASAAGVLFTANPLTGDTGEMVINAAWGLGEAVVAGAVTPDMLVVEKRNGALKRLHVGNKLLMTIALEHGTMEGPVPDEMRAARVLTDEQVAELVRLGRAVEDTFGSPQDIEWAIADRQVFALQARPITTMLQGKSALNQGKRVPPGDDDWDREECVAPQPFDLWTRTNVGENMPFPLTPLTATNFPRLFQLESAQAKPGETQSQGTRRFYGRIYIIHV